jgi:6-phosphofructokinase 1
MITTTTKLNVDIDKLGKATIPNPMRDVDFADDNSRILYNFFPNELKEAIKAGEEPVSFEFAGPREKIYFDPQTVKCGIVTCGGLCPGLNDVIRAIVLSLTHHYGVKTIYGIRNGYEGLNQKYGHKPLELTPKSVNHIEMLGGTILGSSRGPQPLDEMVKTMKKYGIGILFTIGGDGTQKGAQAIYQEIKRQGEDISVIGIPKTIDNDISFVQQTFGFQTAVTEARVSIVAAHNEAKGMRNSIGLVRLMGRDSGFIAGFTALADSQVNYCLVPEVPFTLKGLISSLEKRLERSGHAVIVAAEGAGQDIMPASNIKDASGNVKHADIGLFLRDEIKAHFDAKGIEINMRYIDPSYTIRSIPANAYDSAFCLLLGHNAVHAGMSGRTNMIVGYWGNHFTHVPISLATSQRKKIDRNGWVWNSVLAATGQPKNMN